MEMDLDHLGGNKQKKSLNSEDGCSRFFNRNLKHKLHVRTSQKALLLKTRALKKWEWKALISVLKGSKHLICYLGEIKFYLFGWHQRGLLKSLGRREVLFCHLFIILELCYRNPWVECLLNCSFQVVCCTVAIVYVCSHWRSPWHGFFPLLLLNSFLLLS